MQSKIYCIGINVLLYILICLNGSTQNILNLGGNTFSAGNTKLEWSLGESASVKGLNNGNISLQTGLLQSYTISNVSSSPSSSLFDIGFILQGYDSNRMFYDTSSFAPIAKNLVRMLHELSFGRVNTYKIYMGGVDNRSPVGLTSDINAMTLQASLDGWPDARWDWLRNLTGFWYSVPAFYRPIVNNAILWIKANKKTFTDWKLSTPDGISYGDSLQNNIIRMGPDASESYLQSTKLPDSYNPLNHKVTFLAFNTNKSDNFMAAGSQMLYYMGVKMFNGDTIPPYAGAIGSSAKVEGLYLSLDSFKLTNSVYYYTAVHELVHSYGVNTHDKDPNYINKAYGVLNSNGALESIHGLPAWDRYFFAGWLSKNTITTNFTEISDLFGKTQLSDTSKKYILQITAGDDRGCGGTYKELYDGKWYTYTVDNYGTLTYIAPIDNTNYGLPIIEVQPFERNAKPGDKVFFNVQASGIQNTYSWKKDGVIINGANTNYFSVNSVMAKDTGMYQVIITNAKGVVYSDIVKLSMTCPTFVVPDISTNKNTTLCQGDSLKLNSIYTGINSWYKDGVALNVNSSTLQVKQPGLYSNLYTETNGCSAMSNSIIVSVVSPLTPVISRDSLNNLVSTSLSNIWYKDGVQISDSLKIIKPANIGFYSAKSNVNGCISPMSNTYYFLITDIVNISNEEYIKISPNPFEEFIHIDFVIRGYSVINLEIVNIATGNLVFIKKDVFSKSVIRLSALPSGTYAFKVSSNDNKVKYIFKIVKI